MRCRALLLATTFCGCMCIESRARADPSLRAGADVGAFIDTSRVHGESSGAALAVGGTALLGYRIFASRAFVVPEAGVGYFGVDDAYSRKVMRFVGGARVGWLGSIAPSAYLHAGYALSWGEDGDAVLERNGPTLDGGMAIDFSLGLHVAVGPHAGAGVMFAETGNGTQSTPWLLGGVHVTATFERQAPRAVP